jgi:hypothetical protein
VDAGRYRLQLEQAVRQPIVNFERGSLLSTNHET